MYRTLPVLLLALTLFTQLAHGWPPTYGGELTFTNSKVASARYGVGNNLVDRPENVEAQVNMAAAAQKLCPECAMTFEPDKYGVRTFRFRFPDGWSFRVSVDPQVVEVQTDPLTNAQSKKKRKRIQQIIFGAAEAADLKPSPAHGGGHIHIGLKSAFGDDALLFRNFLVDFWNHFELSTGILEDDPDNAPSLSSLSGEQMKALKALIARFDAGQMPRTAEALAKALNEVYAMHAKRKDDIAMATKDQALSVDRIANAGFPLDEQTLEVRAIRAQLNAGQFVRLIDLFDHRIRKLKKLKKPIRFIGESKRNRPLLVKLFKTYIAQSGLNPAKYADFIPKGPPRPKPIDKKTKAQCLALFRKIKSAVEK